MISVTSCRRAALKRSASVIGSVAALVVGSGKKDLAESLAEPRATRLARDMDVDPAAFEMAGKDRRLRGLA